MSPRQQPRPAASSAPRPTARGKARAALTHLDQVLDPDGLRARFWASVEKGRGEEACWIWTAGRGNSGYGLVSVSGPDGARKRSAHRVAWMLAHGSLPPREVHVCHRCDTPACVRPDHLFLGSHADNMRDASLKGRKKGRGGHGGAANGRSRLPAREVLRLRALPYRRGMDTEWARRLGVTVSAVHLARTGKTWATLPMPGEPGWAEAIAGLDDGRAM